MEARPSREHAADLAICIMCAARYLTSESYFKRSEVGPMRFCGDDDLRKVMGNNDTKLKIAAIRNRGWAVSPNETMIGLNALAAPIYDAFGKYAGSIAMTDSIQFIGETPTNEQLQHLREAARKISANLGFREPVRPLDRNA